MTPSYLRRDAGIRDRWMISYMDVLTILLIFFVAIQRYLIAGWGAGGMKG